MWKIKVTAAVLSATLLGAVSTAQAEEDEPDYADMPEGMAMAAPDQAAGASADSPIPPYVENGPLAYPTGGYCFVGSHPVDARLEGGNGWDDTQGAHIHNSPPIDLRLYTYVGSSRVDLQACKLEYSIVSPK